MTRAETHFPPRPRRDAAQEPAALMLACGGEAPIVLRNLSTGGFMAECERFVHIGSRIALGWPGGGMRHAQVRWALPGRFGAAFCEAETAAPTV